MIRLNSTDDSLLWSNLKWIYWVRNSGVKPPLSPPQLLFPTATAVPSKGKFFLKKFGQVMVPILFRNHKKFSGFTVGFPEIPIEVWCHFWHFLGSGITSWPIASSMSQPSLSLVILPCLTTLEINSSLAAEHTLDHIFFLKNWKCPSSKECGGGGSCCQGYRAGKLGGIVLRGICIASLLCQQFQ